MYVHVSSGFTYIALWELGLTEPEKHTGNTAISIALSNKVPLICDPVRISCFLPASTELIY